MINFHDFTDENKTGHNLKWPYILDHPYRILIMEVLDQKTDALLNLINNQPDIDKIFLYAKDPHEAKYQHLIKKRIKVDLNHYDDLKTFIKYSNGMQDVYKNTEEHNLEKT